MGRVDACWHSRFGCCSTACTGHSPLCPAVHWPCAHRPPPAAAPQESELTPTGANLLDGRYAVFGYVTEGSSLLKEMQVGAVGAAPAEPRLSLLGLLSLLRQALPMLLRREGCGWPTGQPAG